jgi:hypothetical protein
MEEADRKRREAERARAVELEAIRRQSVEARRHREEEESRRRAEVEKQRAARELLERMDALRRRVCELDAEEASLVRGVSQCDDWRACCAAPIRDDGGVAGRRSTVVLRVRGETMGPGKDESVGKSQSVLIVIHGFAFGGMSCRARSAGSWRRGT